MPLPRLHLHRIRGLLAVLAAAAAAPVMGSRLLDYLGVDRLLTITKTEERWEYLPPQLEGGGGGRKSGYQYGPGVESGSGSGLETHWDAETNNHSIPEDDLEGDMESSSGSDSGSESDLDSGSDSEPDTWPEMKPRRQLKLLPTILTKKFARLQRLEERQLEQAKELARIWWGFGIWCCLLSWAWFLSIVLPQK